MKVWIVTIGEPLPIDGNGKERQYRAGILASMLTQRGHEVVWWCSTFNHVQKQQRFLTDTSVNLENGVELKLLHGCGYKRNISFKRLIDHAILARKFKQQAENLPSPDVILCSLPPLELPVSVTRYGKLHGVPVLIDVRDLWPDVFLDFIPGWAKKISRYLMWPMRKQVIEACKNAVAICGTSPRFVEWGLELANREQQDYDRDFPLGYVVKNPSDSDINEAYDYWKQLGINKDDGIFTICFFGTLGRQFDLETVIDAARIMESRGIKARFVICGDGENLVNLRNKGTGLSSVFFPGWVDSTCIWTLMHISQVGLAPYLDNAGFSDNFPNKTIEYLSSGLPVVSSLLGYFKDLQEEYKCGVYYPVGSVESLVDTLQNIISNPEEREIMVEQSIILFDEKFRADKVYSDMINNIISVADKGCL